VLPNHEIWHHNIWTDDIGIPGQDGTRNASDENTYNTVSVHQSQLQPSNSQKAISEIEEMTTHHLEQKKPCVKCLAD
jgi:hypothetical protein